MKANNFTLESLKARCVVTTGGCWLWLGYLEHGYARARLKGKKVLLHKVSYELVNGVVSKEFELDHLCRNKSCLNPDHLEAVTHKENTLRGNSFSAINSRKTLCPKGHPLDGENLYVDSAGHRRCSICKKEQQKKANYKFRHKNKDV